MKARNIAIGIVVALAILAVAALCVAWLGHWGAFGIGPGMMMRGWDRGGLFWGPRLAGGPVLLLLGLLAIAALVGLVWLVASLFERKPVPPSRPESPLDILKRRYALGEISREEYERMKEELG